MDDDGRRWTTVDDNWTTTKDKTEMPDGKKTPVTTQCWAAFACAGMLPAKLSDPSVLLGQSSFPLRSTQLLTLSMSHEPSNAINRPPAHALHQTRRASKTSFAFLASRYPAQDLFFANRTWCLNQDRTTTYILRCMRSIATPLQCHTRITHKSDGTKAQPKAQTQPLQSWNPNDLNAISEDQSFVQELSPPRFTHPSGARPGTANSMRDNSNWRNVFKNRAMTSSMVDLTGGRRRRQSSVGSLRCAASDMNLRLNNALSAAHHGGRTQPGMPSKPATFNNPDFVNPLNVHCPRESPTSPLATTTTTTRTTTTTTTAATPTAPTATTTATTTPTPTPTPHVPNAAALAASPSQKPKPAPIARKRLPENPSLGSSEEAGDAGDGKDTRHAALDHTGQPHENHVIRNGYPSPPQSDKNSEGESSPVNRANSDSGASVNKRNPSSSLRKVEVPGAQALPSPAASLLQPSEDRKEGPIIRAVSARRDTIGFHQPRGRGLTMEFECIQKSPVTHPPKEGFSGNFADFDFGESVTKLTRSTSAQVHMNRIDQDARRGGVSPILDKESCYPIPTSRESSGHEPIHAAQQSEREQSQSPVPTQASDDQVTNSSLIDQLPEPPRELTRRPSVPSSVAAAAAANLDRKASQEPIISLRQGFQSSRFNSEISSRAPPPRPLQSLTPAASQSIHKLGSTAISPCEPRRDNVSSSNSSSSYVRGLQPTSRVEVRPPSSPFARRPLEGAFTVTNGLPRGRLPESLQTPAVSSPLNHEEDDESNFQWSDLGRSVPRQSALPAPLTPVPLTASPARANHATTSPAESPAESPQASPVAPMSPSAAPRIPSPTFPSLADFMSTSGSTFGTPFTFDFDEQLNSPALSGLGSMSRQPSTSAVGNKRRDEDKTVAPQLPLTTLPPSPNKEGGAPLSAGVEHEILGISKVYVSSEMVRHFGHFDAFGKQRVWLVWCGGPWMGVKTIVMS
ncbi:hypothetical protein E4U54_002927 [Claviceps lovelessii]|nr:hypothetical protein E4U54_002927 [Claviceps lovelessii]